MNHDVIVVGARAAGSPTAMLLAGRGYDVLAVDRATFPSDTLSTHIIHAPGVASLQRWGLLDRVVASGCPAITGYTFDLGPVTISGTTRPVGGIDVAYAPRRTVLDQILVDGAREAGAEIRENCNVQGLVVEDGVVRGVRCDGREERARLVIGADGRNSRVARAVGAKEYNAKPRQQYFYFAYFSGLPTDRFENYVRPDRGFGIAPTNDGLTMVVCGWPYAEAAQYKADVEGNFLRTLALVPEFADRLAGARRETPFRGGAVPGWFRKPHGDGWALVGDAGYIKDPITAQGISDAFHDAERCAGAVDRWLGQEASYDDAMAAWRQERDASAMPIYEYTAEMASMAPPSPELEQLFGAMQGNQSAMDDFVSVFSGAVSPVTFFSEENIGRIFAEAASTAGAENVPSDSVVGIVDGVAGLPTV